MGRGIELPEFADLGALPAADGGRGFGVGFGMGELVFAGPATNLGAVEFVVTEPQDFTGREAVVGGRGGAEAFVQEREDIGGPDGGVIATGAAGHPEVLLVVGAGGQVSGVEFVEATAGEVELAGGGGDFDLLRAELGEDVADQRGGETMGELVFFMWGECRRKRRRRESERLDLSL